MEFLFLFLLLSIGPLSLSTDDSPKDHKITCSPGEAMFIAYCSKRDHSLDSRRSILEEEDKTGTSVGWWAGRRELI